ncbi:MAG: helix-turn-helix domain-containing protein [Cellulosilyticaceae bacterium]
MNEKLQKLMQIHEMSFEALARELNVNKRTLTRKFNGSTDWTYQEMMILSELLEIDDIEAFFFSGM